MDDLAGREPELWKRVESLIEAKCPKGYDEAIKVLVDLRDLAARQGRTAEFDLVVRVLRERHARKPAFLQRLERVGRILHVRIE